VVNDFLLLTNLHNMRLKPTHDEDADSWVCAC
jgi:hypothetical protein